MNPLMDRRFFLGALAGTAASASLPRRAAAQASQALEAVALSDGLFQVSGAGANVVVRVASDSLLLVDGGLRERSAELLKLISERWPGRPVRTLFNTNWRWQHTGSNEVLGSAGATIIAHENTRLWLGADFSIDWEHRVHKPAPPFALPNETFYTSGDTAFDGASVHYGHFPQAHTDGDLYVFFPRANVLAASDLLTTGTYPIFDYVTGGWVGGMERASSGLLALMDSQTRIIPAVGPALGRAALRAQLELCTAMKDRVGGMIKNGKSLEEVIAAAPTKDFDAHWGGDRELFLALTYKGLWGHIRELGGVL